MPLCAQWASRAPGYSRGHGSLTINASGDSPQDIANCTAARIAEKERIKQLQREVWEREQSLDFTSALFGDPPPGAISVERIEQWVRELSVIPTWSS
jgi:hypothetical protein